MASAKALYDFPTMIVTEDNTYCNGIFDDKIVNNDKLMFKINYKGLFTSEDEQTITHWNRAVEQYNVKK